ncbi:MAG TPA: hypothetical protein PLX89_23395, partial [Verrucomicrobiota bacterium]|nr:hypothetical protein [Verrucomicrobiota bacterium]
MVYVCWLTPLSGAEPAEQLAFDSSVRDFDLGQWARAAQSLAEFEAKFPQSPLLRDAVRLRQFAQAELAFWLSDWTNSATAFADFIKANPEAPRSGIAAVREAQARLNLGDRAGALRVLEEPDGPFAKRLAAGIEPGVLFSGLIVKAEALRAESKWTEATAVLNQAAPFAKTPAEIAARWQLLAVVEEGAGHWEAAAQAAEAWGQTLGEEGSVERRAEAAALAGRMWTRAGKPDEARAAFTRNLADRVPVARQLEAALALADASLARDDLASARGTLQAYLTGHPADPGNAAVRLRLGQTLFRQFVALGGLTNSAPDALALLALASAQFADGLTNAPPPEIAGPLNLGRGWSTWYEALAANNTDRFRDSGTNFAMAATLLPRSAEQA